MSNDKFQAEINYQVSSYIVKALFEKKLLTREEYTVINTNLESEFAPFLGSLLSKNNLIY